MSFGEHPPETTTQVVKDALDSFRKAELKQIIKEAIREWLDEQATNFGKWSFRFIATAALGTLAYFILINQGWHK